MPTDEQPIIRKYVLVNAVEHAGVAQPKSVLGKVLAEFPELRDKLLEIRNLIEDEVDDVNRLSLDKQQEELESLGGYEKEVKVEIKELPELDRGKTFVVRFAPNPDGAIHLGNCRVAVLNYEYVKRYKGKYILRFDDTDPKIKTPEKEFYEWIKEDLKWLGMKWDKEIIASKRLPIYYKYAEQLLDENKAYVCECDVVKWRKKRDKGRACPCRKLDKKEHKKRWNMMKTHEYKEGEAVLRLKTELDMKNPAVRDWPAFRIIDEPKHPLVKGKHLWPLYNFASAIDDRLLGVTHILRGQEHSTNEAKQRYLYQYMGWTYPSTSIVGRFSMSDMVMSKSEIRKGIANGKFSSWDDPNLGTIKALKRRGFTPEAIRNLIVDIGLKPNDITVSMENLAAYNKKVIDERANRYFFIPTPKKITLDKLPFKTAKIPLHPEKKRGFRNFKLSKVFYIDRDDFEKYHKSEIRLKDLMNIKLHTNAKYTSKEPKNIPKIQWVTDKYASVRVVKPKGTIKGYGELAMKNLKKGQIIQMERFGFGIVEKITKNNVVIVFSHK